ncbi:fructosamine kinase family protein [Vibrio sp. SM6]|uniref:Fructosamine kinase family protein n=1 Tax=Vibrio agarilyticus TaxID=2726741 RepID=A0A7X8TPP6_9VIBR|nr:fructosamine kinase family protein [Vibrio agarilyticus]NLS12657.1 fructosamine kinase family protein [Vibrio agarilyticus]
MWQAISQQLSETLQFDFNIDERIAIDGGDINQCYMLSDGEERYFIKINERRHRVVFEAEARNLAALRASSTLFVPEFVATGATGERAFIILNYIPTRALALDSDSIKLGEQLARLHLWGEQKEYGFDEDNYIGTTLQPNSWHKRWSSFFSEQRVGWQLQLLKEKGVVFADIDDLIQLIEKQLAGHQPTPSLLHGNLCQGNTSSSPFGPLCFNPSSYWGDRECDIAMTQLFKPFSDSFYASYQSVAPLDSGFIARQPVYNLYHLLNHCLLFGGEYINQTNDHIRHLLAR